MDFMEALEKVRNIGILRPIAHGKTTLSEKICTELLERMEKEHPADKPQTPQSPKPETE